jgi:hypothetical protein
LIRQSLSVAASLLAFTVVGCSSLFPTGGGGGPDTTPPAPTGCAAATTKHVAPGGYYVAGNTVCTSVGQPHLFHGVDRPSLEWSPTGQNISAADFQLMATGWNANVVRIALNQDFWLADSPYANAGYPALVDSAVKWAEQAGMDVILDLHWSDAGTLGGCNGGCQELMADANSITFWSQLAAVYKNDGRVLFELYNEPHDVTWATWLSGGPTSEGWTAAGMQQLYDAVRGAQADNLVIAGGLQYAYDLSGVPDNRIKGYNILYATHPYGGAPEKAPARWDSGWGFLTRTDPVIVTEFGDGADCGTDTAIQTYVSSLISYADLHLASWTAWAWFPGGCQFPAIIGDWQGTPTSPAGTVVQAALLGYSQPAPGGKRDGGTTAAGGAGGALGGGGAGGIPSQDGGAATGAAGAAGRGSAGAAG